MNNTLLQQATLDIKLCEKELFILEKFSQIYFMSDNLIVRKLINRYFKSNSTKKLVDKYKKEKACKKVSIRMNEFMKNKLNECAIQLNNKYKTKIKYNMSIIVKCLIQDLEKETVKRVKIPKEVLEEMNVLQSYAIN